MKEDLSRFDLDVGKVVEETTPELVKERRRKAVQKLVDAGMIERETPPPAADAAAAVGTSAPSPWAKDGASAEIDAAEPPSARMPAAPAEETPVTKAARPAVKAGWHWSQPRKVIAVCAVVGVAMPVLVLLAGHMKETGTAASATPPPSTAASAAAVPSAAATVPSVTVSPTTTADAPPPPTMPAAPSATTMPVPTAPLRKLPRKPQQPREEPHDTVPPAAVTTAPTAPEPPPVPKIIE